MVITLPVICLENGSQGERIRVSSTDRKFTYLGEIVAPGMLRTQL
jgi:flagella basal body P-ring formation protein FlgA